MAMVNVNVAMADSGGISFGSYSSGKFNVDYQQITDLISVLETDTFETTKNAIEGIYSNVESMKDGWSGNGYDTYSQNLNDYKKYLETFQFFLLAYSNILKSVRSDVTTLRRKINNYLNLEEGE